MAPGGFDTQRPQNAWGSVPIHQLMVENGVSAYFHGHDHQYVYETRDRSSIRSPRPA